ncbi:MAG: tetratricopeptide repeat protein [Nitrospiraceae bacterium]
MASCLRLALLLLALICAARPSPVSATLAPKTAPIYVEGLDALADGRWPEAVGAFSRALEQTGDDPDIVLARGVAETLAEDFPRALKDLERAKRLGSRGREPELWTYVTEAMSGIIAVPDHALGGGPRGVPSGRPAVVSIPGHIAQGQDDYSTEYGSFIIYRLGMEYQKHRLPADYGGSGHPEGTKSPQMRQAMREAGRLFAERQYRRPELSSINVARAKKSEGTVAATGNLSHIERALAANPGDPDAHLQAAKAWLEAGRPASARKAFTIALTFKSDLADAYLGRATAAARLGDESRMEADLAVYKKGGWLSTRSSRSAVEDELRNYKAKGSSEALLRELHEQAQAGKPLEVLIETASRLHRVAGEQRRRYDELYQDRIRELEDAVRDNPKHPDRLVELAGYLVSESDNRGEKVEPRREIQPYRFQTSREQELQRAIQLADRALSLNAKHVGAMMQKAVALTALKQYNQADTLADQALNLAGNNADALRLYAKFRAMRANQMSSEAWGLRQERCSSSSHEETRSDGVYRVTSTTCYPPSQADLQRASQLEATATELRRRARSALEKAAAVTKGTVDGDMILADLALWDGKPAEAQAYLEQAVKRDPKSLEARDRLVQHYAQTGQMEKAEEQRVIAANLVQTTAAPLLRLAWNRTEKTAWQGAKNYLARAGAIDPVDARIPAYLGVVHEGDDKPSDAGAQYRVALALEEARLKLDDLSGQKGADPGRDAMEFGAAIQARLHLARLTAAAGNQADALAHYQAILGYERRLGRGFESRQMFTALWPDQQPEGGAWCQSPRMRRP